MQNGERGGQDLAQRFEQLQRTVRDLAATVSSQAARSRDESQAQSARTENAATATHGHHQTFGRAVHNATGVLGTQSPRAFLSQNRAMNVTTV